jgi:carbon storage regulator
MFVVARHKGQSIHIGNDIEVVVTALSRTTVKLGIIAPKPLSILRTEIRDQIAEENRDALHHATEESTLAGTATAGETIVTSARDFLTAAVNAPTPRGVNQATGQKDPAE